MIASAVNLTNGLSVFIGSSSSHSCDDYVYRSLQQLRSVHRESSFREQSVFGYVVLYECISRITILTKIRPMIQWGNYYY